MPFTTLWREPLLHFLLIGVVLFLIYSIRNDSTAAAPKQIVITPVQIEQLSADFERTWSRTPNADELEVLIENAVRNEVFYREAISLGLDQNDPIVRRRMRQKLEFILEDLSSATLQKDHIQAYFEQNAERYRREGLISFKQVYLNPDHHGDLETAAETILDRLAAGADPATQGDRTMLAAAYERVSANEIARNFGTEFAQGIAHLSPGKWNGPIFSAFGAHLVKINQKTEAQIPDFALVREQVRRDYLNQWQAEQKDLAYRKLREGYAITIERLGHSAQ